MRMKLVVPVLFLLGAACAASIEVRSDYDGSVNFASYRTYDWLPEPDRGPGAAHPPSKSFMDRRVKVAVNNELLSKGYRKSRNPDFLITYHANVKNRVDVTTHGYGYRRSFTRRVYVDHYKEGALILDIIDPRTKELVWRGWGTGVVDEGKAEQQVRKTVTKILEQFPPGSEER